MADISIIKGMVLKSQPVGDYDRRLVILSKEEGKVVAFARGARRTNSPLLGATTVLNFGEFKLHRGRLSNAVSEAHISEAFQNIKEDMEKLCYGTYFAEIADYYSGEDNDELEMLKLIYQSLRAMNCINIDIKLVRYIYELKAMAINGELDTNPDGGPWREATLYALEFIYNTSIEKLYTFSVTGEVLMQLSKISDMYRSKLWDRKFNSLEVLDTLILR